MGIDGNLREGGSQGGPWRGVVARVVGWCRGEWWVERGWLGLLVVGRGWVARVQVVVVSWWLRWWVERGLAKVFDFGQRGW